MNTADAKSLLKPLGYCDVRTNRDKDAPRLWWATAKEGGLALWRSESGSTRKRALKNLVTSIRQAAKAEEER